MSPTHPVTGSTWGRRGEREKKRKWRKLCKRKTEFNETKHIAQIPPISVLTLHFYFPFHFISSFSLSLISPFSPATQSLSPLSLHYRTPRTTGSGDKAEGEKNLAGLVNRSGEVLTETTCM